MRKKAMASQASSIVEGVALLLFDTHGEKIFCVRELVSKPETDKVAGTLSLPCETLEVGETLESALERLILEEVDRCREIAFSSPEYLGAVPLCEGRALAHTFVAFLGETTEEQSFFGEDEGREIAFAGFLFREELLANGRAGMETILQAYERSQKICMQPKEARVE